MSESNTKKLNVEGAVVTPPSPTEEKLPTYKVIPEGDTEYKAVPNSNMVKENGENCKDGADEKMLSPKGDLADVKFITGDQQNGDAKIDILEIKQAFTGLTKEELLKFSNDPFWVRLRWVMFIGFWLLWVGMLAGAIIIIIGAPKCAPPQPKTWWQDGPLMEASPAKDEPDSKWNLTTLLEKMSAISELKVKGLIIPEAMLPGDDSYSAINASLEELQPFNKLVELSKEKNIKLIVGVTANSVSKSNSWFSKSENQEEIYKDYFIWKDGKSQKEENPEPPNNWVSKSNEAAWTYSNTRKQFYLHHLDEKPNLDMRNPQVVNEFEKVIQFWIKNGASGIRLSHGTHLLVDPTFADEQLSQKPGADLRNYDFYKHSKTSYQDGLGELLLNFKNVVRKDLENEGVLMLDDSLSSIEAFKVNGTMVVDLPRVSKIMDESISSQPSKTAQQFEDSLNSAFILLEGAWPSWKFYSKDAGSEYAIMSTLLPGVPIITLDQALDAESNETKASDEYNELMHLREQFSFKYGGYDSTLLANNTVFSFTRFKSGSPGIMVLYNPGTSLVHVNTTSINAVPEKLTVKVLSKNYNYEGVTVNTKLDSDKIPLTPKSVIALSYVATKD